LSALATENFAAAVRAYVRAVALPRVAVLVQISLTHRIALFPLRHPQSRLVLSGQIAIQ
jgi:hypothetical protein